VSEPVLRLHRGTTPLLVSLPHCGELIPDELRPRYLPRALAVEDTDWHLHKLYAFAAEMGASVLQPAMVPDKPVKPNKALTLAAALLMGCVLGIGFATFREWQDARLRTPDEILPLCDTRVVAVGRHDGRGANSPVRARFVHIWTWKLAEAEAVVYGLDLPVTDLPITISAEARLMRGRYRACSNGLGLAAGRAIASPR